MNSVHRFVTSLIRLLWRKRQFKGRIRLIMELLKITPVAPSKYGPLIRVRRHDFTNRVSIFGSYGDEIPEQIRTLSPDHVFMDIGANAGIFSLIASDIVSDGFVFAFEPNPRTYRDLCFNIDANDASNVIPLNLALSDSDGILTIAHDPAHSGLSTLKQPSDGSVGRVERKTEHAVVVLRPERLVPLMDLTRTRRVGMKIDVEGHELNVIRGLKAAGLLDRTDWIVVEINSEFLTRHDASVQDLYKELMSAGLQPTKGENHAPHYDEIFRAANRDN